jgi:hypothetical protein
MLSLMPPAHAALSMQVQAKRNAVEVPVQAKGKAPKRKAVEDRNADDHAHLRARMHAGVRTRFLLLPRGDIGIFIVLPAGKGNMRVAHRGCTRSVLIALLEALLAKEKDKRLRAYLEKLKESERKAAAGVCINWCKAAQVTLLVALHVGSL